MSGDTMVPSAPAQDLDLIARVFDDTNVIIHGVLTDRERERFDRAMDTQISRVRRRSS